MWIADLHIHSRFARATSRQCEPVMLDWWARRKGIDVLGTGDCTHAGWRAMLADALVPDGSGFYRLREDLRQPGAPEGATRFVVSGEISSIYKKRGRVRKVHNVVLFPSLADAEKFSARLEGMGANLRADGRPILGLDSRDLLEIALESCPEAEWIPAHIWTPHFSLFGAYSGFDAIEECFEDMTPHIHALETGLSSDPPMNWRLSALDRYTLVSHSDAHSPANLGREANLLDCPLTYADLTAALRDRAGSAFAGTLEFFPEEGKYHWDGHRACAVRMTPAQRAAADGLCPVCGKRVTVGVLSRVEALADRPEGVRPEGARPYERLAPLAEVIAASVGLGASSVKVQRQYDAILRALGPVLEILRRASVADVQRVAGPCVAEGIRRLREGKVELEAGFDGEYGHVRLLQPEEIRLMGGQMSLLGALSVSPTPRPAAARPVPRRSAPPAQEAAVPTEAQEAAHPMGLNDRQWEAVSDDSPVVSVQAGPGTGKTHTLVCRAAYLIGERGVAPSDIGCVTFTNKAAREMRERLASRLAGRQDISRMTIGTFHAICLRIVRAHRGPVVLLDEAEAEALAGNAAAALGLKLTPRKALEAVSAEANGLAPAPAGLGAAYRAACDALGALDFDGLLLAALEAPDGGFAHLLVDEFQDISPVQYRLIRKWALGSRSLFVIGDANQAIYGFRGADARCFARLAEDFPALRTVRLTENYRSTPPILRCAQSVLPGRPEVPESRRASGLPVCLVRAADGWAEAVFVAKEIARRVGGVDMLGAQGESAVSFSDIAVLYRTHRQAALLEECLQKEGIPYVVAGRDALLEDPAARRAVAFCRLLCFPEDRPARRALGLDEAVLRDALSAWAPRAHGEPPARWLAAWMAQQGIPAEGAAGRLLRMAVLCESTGELVEGLTFGREADLRRCGTPERRSEAVSLMTLHAAKGLEYETVFLCGVREGLMPLHLPGRESDEKEERRLLFVGMTRARASLILVTPGVPSPFLRALPEAFVSQRDAHEGRPRPEGRQLSFL